MPRTKKRRKMMSPQPRTFKLEVKWDKNGNMKMCDGIKGLLSFARACEQKQEMEGTKNL
jgi:hypothetical protein